MLDLRQRLFLITSIVILGVLAIVLGILAIQRQGQRTQSEVGTTVDGQSPTNGNQATVFDPTLQLPPVIGDPNALGSKLADEDQTERYVRQRAIDFVERFLSYSNQTRNSNIRDVLPMVTPQMASWVKTQVHQYSDTYVGSTTKVIVSRIDAITTSSATVHIEAQQHLESLENDERVYHSGRVELSLLDGIWYIEGLYWE
ncbi:MAG: hypothetical protein COU32_02005 [Candidatus Magasanikbacteria bacterium CG10_big_fil_rev_8_21_14_0_10_42_10]|uniref:Tim44-like domain-containing protein n=2 Tax=Candidatus Magasanikiibacteriota TaxID=1752731 RepID=A0A2H0TWB9_9BACT|nr:MAG: hypothetical protein COU32_02005 [Candidatus Magasanikbacteria bacterium CG10_big_fil_rev_8_21_14_0_10_42_10]PIZ93327.1 MAG: hypothetical protein COX82_02780 [Candidatus Magasanikbacteria bacterium CG_4_10_14_0_2_um_filter_41_10]